MRRAACLIMLLALAACAGKSLPEATGPWRQLNIGKWSFSDNALTSPLRGSPDERHGRHPNPAGGC